MAEYIGDDEAHSCPYMYLWNPLDVGSLGAYTSMALVEEKSQEKPATSLRREGHGDIGGNVAMFYYIHINKAMLTCLCRI